MRRWKQQDQPYCYAGASEQLGLCSEDMKISLIQAFCEGIKLRCFTTVLQVFNFLVFKYSKSLKSIFYLVYWKDYT